MVFFVYKKRRPDTRAIVRSRLTKFLEICRFWTVSVVSLHIQKRKGIAMNKILCALFPLALFVSVSSCGQVCDSGSSCSDGQTGDLRINNKTSWLVSDVKTGDSRDKSCTEILPGESALFPDLFAPAEPKQISVTFMGIDGTTISKVYPVAMTPNAVAVLSLEEPIGEGGSAPTIGTVSVPN